MSDDITVIDKRFTCPKCYTTYYHVVKLTIDSGICAGCRQATDIPDYIPVEQHERWWENYKWQKI
jgi:hypothetical protein